MEKARIKEILQDMFPQGSTAYTFVTKVAPSGMSRHILVTGSGRKGHVQNVSWYIAELLDYKYKPDTRSVFVGGCGMDMGFHLVYSLSSVLYDDGYAIEQQWL
jgi:hypothetical protein|tara:strand:- start:4742 stop:5050 length:309 start_codon:yes stop_codon:yes gene_type:complete